VTDSRHEGPSSPLHVKIGAVVSVLAGVGVLAVEIPRFRSGASIEIWLWGAIALFAIGLGLFELISPRLRRR